MRPHKRTISPCQALNGAPRQKFRSFSSLPADRDLNPFNVPTFHHTFNAPADLTQSCANTTHKAFTRFSKFISLDYPCDNPATILPTRPERENEEETKISRKMSTVQLPAATHRKRVVPQADLEAASILRLGEDQNTHTLTLSEARLVINKVLENKRRGGKKYEEPE